jgi:hypothetical protein
VSEETSVLNLPSMGRSGVSALCSSGERLHLRSLCALPSWSFLSTTYILISSCFCPYLLAGVLCDILNQCDGATVDLIRWEASLARSLFRLVLGSW